jgi:hypothetical protein
MSLSCVGIFFISRRERERGVVGEKKPFSLAARPGKEEDA